VTEHISSAQIVNYQRRMLAPAELLSVDDHLAECAECRRFVASTLNNDVAGLYAGLAAEASASPHLSFDQSAAYIDGMPAGEERRMIEDHLASCAICAPLTEDLRAFRNEIAPDLDREYGPEEAVESTPRDAWRDRIKVVLRAPFFKTPLWIYAALLLLAASAWVAMRLRTTQEIGLTTPSPTLSPSIEAPSPAPPTQPVQEAAPVIVRLNDGGSSLALDSQGRVAGMDQWPAEYRRMAVDAMLNQQAPGSPLLAGLSRPGSPLMGGGDEGRRFAIIEPAGKVLLTDRPTFKWTRLEGAGGYVVEIYDAQFNLIASSPELTDLNWNAPRLARAKVYSWQVKATSGGQEFIAPHPTAPQAKFRILDQAAASEIARARRDYGSSHLLLGLLYARAGLLTEAEYEFRALQKANPDSDTARKLLGSLSSQRR
jgi:predicted anti-sigma-YlaC factor YlaD